MSEFPRRIATGFAAAVLSVLIVHQGAWAALHALDLPGLAMPPAFPMSPAPPLGLPRLVSLCFWGGIWGASFAAIWRGSWWLGGLCLGLAAILAGYFVVGPLKGIPASNAFQLNNWLRSLFINLPWAFATAFLIRPRRAG